MVDLPTNIDSTQIFVGFLFFLFWKWYHKSYITIFQYSHIYHHHQRYISWLYIYVYCTYTPVNNIIERMNEIWNMNMNEIRRFTKFMLVTIYYRYYSITQLDNHYNKYTERYGNIL